MCVYIVYVNVYMHICTYVIRTYIICTYIFVYSVGVYRDHIDMNVCVFVIIISLFENRCLNILRNTI